MKRSLTVFFIVILLSSLSLWAVGHQYADARSQVTYYESFSAFRWSHTGIFELDLSDSSWIQGKIRVGENVSIAILRLTMTSINTETVDRVGLTFRIFINQIIDYPQRSKAIVVETYHIFNPGETFWTELCITFNETLKFGNETVTIKPGEELSLRGSYEFDETCYYKNGDILTIPREMGGGPEEITVENSQNPLLMFFLESIAEKFGQAGVAIMFIAFGTRAVLAQLKRK